MNEQKKGTVLQSVKAVAVLVAICLVCIGLLAICYDFFYISPEEHARREEVKINKSLTSVYPAFVQDTAFAGKLDKDFSANPAYGSVSKVVKSTDGTYIIAAEGVGGYGGKPVTVLVAIDKTARIVGWQISNGGDETQLDNLKGVNSTWYIGEQISTDLSLQKVAGTTMSSQAVNNAIKMASYYAMNVLHLGSNPEADAKDAVLALLGEGYEDCVFTSYNNILPIEVAGNTVSQLLSDDDNTISYLLKATGDKEVTAFVYGTDADRKIVAVTDEGVVNSSNVTGDESFAKKAASARVLSTNVGGDLAYALITDIDTTDPAKTVYTVAGLKFATTPDSYLITVEIVKDGTAGKVSAITIEHSGYAPFGMEESAVNAIADKLQAAGVTSTAVANFDTYKVSGATHSSRLVTVAVTAALADFDASLNGR